MVDDVLVQHIVERPVDIRSIDDHDDAFTDEPFDLATADVFRVGWRQTGPERHRLVFVLHHVAVDELSLPILFDDFADAYRAAAAGHEPGLKEPATRYLDLASRERGTRPVRHTPPVWRSGGSTSMGCRPSSVSPSTATGPSSRKGADCPVPSLCPRTSAVC